MSLLCKGTKTEH